MNTKTTSSTTKVKLIRFHLDGITYLITSPSTVKVISNKNKFHSDSIQIPTTISYKGADYIVNKIGASAFANNYDLSNVIIPSSISVIENKAFANNPNLIQVVCNITTPTTIHKDTFGDVLKDCKLIVPTASLKSYKNSDVWMFFGLITDVSPFTVAGISYEKTSETTVKVVKKFDENYSGSITIPDSIQHHEANYNVTEISETAFKGNENITAISIGNHICSVDAFTFSKCKNLTSIHIPNSVSSIGKSAFSSCGLTSFIFPNSVTTIESHLFIGCEELSTITIPNSITTIKEYAFGWCPKLTTLICAIESPLKIHSNVFFGTYTSTCQLEVPLNSMEAYKVSYIWKSFKSIKSTTKHEVSEHITKKNMSISPDPTQNNILIDLNDSNEATTEVFTENGQLLIQKTITSSQNSISTHNLLSGMYWVKLTSNMGTITRKFIKY